MKIGMRIVAAILILVGLLMVVLAVLPLIQGTINVGRLIGLSVGGIACLVVGVVFWVGVGSKGLSFLGIDNELLATGRPATAVIKAAKETGISMQSGMYIVLEFNLEVKPEMGSPYQVTCRSRVPRISLGNVGLGQTVAVKVDPNDPNHVAIDWSTVPS